MTHPDDRAYFRKRADHERMIACTTDNIVAAQIHLSLAQEYECRVAALSEPRHASPFERSSA